MPEHTGVLIVDDEHFGTDVMRRSLARISGFEVFFADSYQTALNVFNDNRADVDCSVIDISLPGRNGVELAKALLKEKPTLKVLFTSGWLGADVERSYGVTISPSHFLQKPFRVDELVRRVK